eukprot:scaffold93350_cov17-Tisochrysis_lutea.AAC.2
MGTFFTHALSKLFIVMLVSSTTYTSQSLRGTRTCRPVACGVASFHCFALEFVGLAHIKHIPSTMHPAYPALGMEFLFWLGRVAGPCYPDAWDWLLKQHIKTT